MYFFAAAPVPGGAHRRYASLSCTNDGEIVGLTHERGTEPEAWSVAVRLEEEQAAVSKIRTFITACEYCRMVARIEVEKDRADRAEARVKELAIAIDDNYHGWCGCHYCKTERAARQKGESK